MAVFTKQLRQVDISKRFSVPIKALQHFPKFRDDCYVVDVEVQDECGFYWKFECSIRQKGKYRKPIFTSREWLRFVRFKKLKVGDRVQFNKKIDRGNFRGVQFGIEMEKL